MWVIRVPPTDSSSIIGFGLAHRLLPTGWTSSISITFKRNASGSSMSTGTRKAENTAQRLPQALAQLDEQVLAMVMNHAALPEILDALCGNIEKHYSGLLCSVL